MSGELRNAIDHFCMKEYRSMGDFENPTRVPFLYTYACGDELDDDGDPYAEVELQIYIDMEHFRAIYCFGDGSHPGLVEEFNDEAEMAEAIRCSDFQDWYSSAVDAFRNSGYYKKEWELYYS